MAAKQVGLNGEQVAVPAGKVHRHLEPNFGLNQIRDRDRVDPKPCPRAIRNVDDIGAHYLQLFAACEKLFDVQAARHVELNEVIDLRRIELREERPQTRFMRGRRR